jgi:hypothetical protein
VYTKKPQNTAETAPRKQGETATNLLLGLLILVALAAQANTDAVRHVADTLRPHELVQVGLNSDVLREHDLLSELLDLAQSTGSLVLERTADA